MQPNPVCAQYCIDLIRAVMLEQVPPAMPEGLSLQTLFAFAKEHSVEVLVFHGLQQLSPDEADPVWRHWENRAQMLLTQSIVQLAERDMVFDHLTQAGMELLPVKGTWLKEQYPQIDFRQMADIDILIHREDRARAKSLLQELDFRPEQGDEVASYHDGYEKPPYMAVEMHVQLLPGSNAYSRYYDSIWEKARPVEENSLLRRLPAEDEYIYYLLHMKKHMEEAGCGIRSILDCVVYRDVYPDMDRDYLEQEYDKLGIWEYVLQVEKLADCWFATGESVPESLAEMADSVLWAGAYGTLENKYRIHLEKLKKKYKNPVVLQCVYWCSRFFRPLEQMKFFYPILEKLPFLLPVFWVTRIVKKLIKKPKALLYHVKQIQREGRADGKD